MKRTDLASAAASTVAALANTAIVDPVRDYGFDNTGTTDNAAKAAVMLADIQKNTDERGRRIRFPAGTYVLSTALAFTAYAAGQVHNIILEGDGPNNTVLDFTTAAAGTNGVSFDAGAHFVVRDLTIKNAKQDGLSIGVGPPSSAGSFAFLFTVNNLRILGSARYGLNVTNVYMGSFRDIWCGGSGSSGFNFNGFQTSMDVSRCWASNNLGHGWSINGAVYSKFSACGSDTNGLRGWSISNVCGVTFDSCGSEGNPQEAYYLFTSTASATGLPNSSQDISGLTFINCYALGNSNGTVGGYASFIGAHTADGRPIEFKIQGGGAFGNASGDLAIVLFGVSGQVTCHKELFNDYTFTTPDARSGVVEVKNLTMIGRRTLINMSGAQSIPSSAFTTVTWGTTNQNDLGATVSSGVITIPRGVNRIRVSFSVDFAANATGARQVYINKNGSALLGVPAFATQGMATSDGIMSGMSCPIPVVAGDTIQLQVWQNSGGALNVVTGFYSWLAVEAID